MVLLRKVRIAIVVVLKDAVAIPAATRILANSLQVLCAIQAMKDAVPLLVNFLVQEQFAVLVPDNVIPPRPAPVPMALALEIQPRPMDRIVAMDLNVPVDNAQAVIYSVKLLWGVIHLTTTRTLVTARRAV